MKCSLLLLFLPLVLANLRSDIAKCAQNNKAIQLNNDDAIYFESQDFPQSINIISGCQQIFNVSVVVFYELQIFFQRTDGEEKGFVIILTNGILNAFNITTNPYSMTRVSKTESSAALPSNTTVFDFAGAEGVMFMSISEANSFSFGESNFNFWTAFQGFVYAPSTSGKSSSCLLNGQNLDLIESNRIIPLISLGDFNESEVCTWKLNVLKSMELKIVVREKLDGDLLTVSTDNGKPNSLMNNTAYNFNGTSFTVTYTKNVLSLNRTLSMAILVSQMPVTQKRKIECYRNFTSEMKVIQLQDYVEGYPNNVVSLICINIVIFKHCRSVMFLLKHKGEKEFISKVIRFLSPWLIKS